MLWYYLSGHSWYCCRTRSTRLSTRNNCLPSCITRLSTLSSRLSSPYTPLSTPYIRLSTRSIRLSTRSTCSTICQSFL